MTNFHSWVEIDTKAIKKNLTHITSALGKKCSFVFINKSNGYGHGALEMANLALKHGATYIGVNYVEEAVDLRQNLFKGPIMLFINPLANQWEQVYSLNLTPVIYDLNSLKQLAKISADKKQPVNIHIKIDTGLNRFGFSFYELESVVKLIKNSDNVKVEGLMTHFSTITPTDRKVALDQIKKFNLAVKYFESRGIKPKFVHAASTEAFGYLPESLYNMVRLGDAVYGIYPSSKREYRFPLKPALSWKTKILAIRSIPTGSTVGYRGTWKAKRDSVIAVIGAGYSDGFRRTPYKCEYVICKGFKVPVIGVVSMCNSTIDITDYHPLLKVGDEVVIVGKQNGIERTIDDVAREMGTIGDELVATISSNLPRIYR